MNKPPRGFYLLAAAALLWNAAGLAAVLANLSRSAADIAALPADQQALHAAQPLWSVAGSVVAVVAGTLGCVLLLLRKPLAIGVFVVSLVGIVLQDIGLFAWAGTARPTDPVVWVLQGLVLLIALGLLWWSRRAQVRGWLG